MPDLFLKRTVEGDLGVRINAATIVERAGAEKIADLAQSLDSGPLSASEIHDYTERVSVNPDRVPQNSSDAAIDAALARCATKIAMERHAGTVKEVYTGTGTVLVQYGKDLSAVSTVIGVGGVLAFGKHAEFIMQGVVAPPDALNSLLPERPNFLIDSSYLLYGIGLLAETAPGSAFAIANKVLAKVLAHEWGNANWCGGRLG